MAFHAPSQLKWLNCKKYCMLYFFSFVGHKQDLWLRQISLSCFISEECLTLTCIDVSAKHSYSTCLSVVTSVLKIIQFFVLVQSAYKSTKKTAISTTGQWFLLSTMSGTCSPFVGHWCSSSTLISISRATSYLST